MGWRWGMWAPGIIGVVVGLAVLLFVRDSPEAVGYPPIEAVEKAKKKNTDGSDAEVFSWLHAHHCFGGPVQRLACEQ